MSRDKLDLHAVKAVRRTLLAFTLIETLVVVSVIALLLSVLVPSLAGAREQARTVVCGSNIRQIAIANLMYAVENGGHACPGAAGFRKNLHRWHGTRDTPSGPFMSTKGPLVPYLGSDGAIRACPSFRRFATDPGAFELGSGGYGYNNAYIGVILKEFIPGFQTVETDLSGVVLERVTRSAGTLMFADSAFAADALIEYSFAEPRFHTATGTRADPSIHFRHRGLANIAWCDGHVARRRRTFTWSSGLYRSDPDRLAIGWFGRQDSNAVFDLN